MLFFDVGVLVVMVVGVSAGVGGGHSVEVGCAGVGGLVELAHHNNKYINKSKANPSVNNK